MLEQNLICVLEGEGGLRLPQIESCLLLGMTYPSKIWDKSSVSYARMLGQNLICVLEGEGGLRLPQIEKQSWWTATNHNLDHGWKKQNRKLHTKISRFSKRMKMLNSKINDKSVKYLFYFVVQNIAHFCSTLTNLASFHSKYLDNDCRVQCQIVVLKEHDLFDNSPASSIKCSSCNLFSFQAKHYKLN